MRKASILCILQHHCSILLDLELISASIIRYFLKGYITTQFVQAKGQGIIPQGIILCYLMLFHHLINVCSIFESAVLSELNHKLHKLEIKVRFHSNAGFRFIPMLHLFTNYISQMILFIVPLLLKFHKYFADVYSIHLPFIFYSVQCIWRYVFICQFTCECMLLLIIL
jgi:hypothetical protein